MAGSPQPFEPSSHSLRFPRHAEDQWLHVPHPLLLQPPQLLPREPTNLPSPLKANVENCFVTFKLSHFGQVTRLRLEVTRFSKLCEQLSQMNS